MPSNFYGPFEIPKDLEWSDVLEEFVRRQQSIAEALIDQALNPENTLVFRAHCIREAKTRLLFVDRALGITVATDILNQIPD